MQKVAIVGASLAGLSAVRALRNQGFPGEIVVIGDEPHAPYDRPPLSKDFLTGAAGEADLALARAHDDLGATWRLGVTATRLDPAGRSVHLSDGDEIRADGVIIATGARARRLRSTDRHPEAEGDPAGRPGAGVHTLRTLDDAVALRGALRQAGRLVVVGAGFIGAEVASSARSLGWDVTVVEALPTPLAGPLGAEMGEICARLHGDHGVRLLTGTPITGLTGSDQVELADGTRLEADLVIAGIGSVPNVEWLAGSGLTLANGVVTDAGGATGLPGVVATGDCASIHGVRSEHWTHAVEHPAIAVATLLGNTPPESRPPYFWSAQYGVHLQFAGRRAPGDTVRIVEGDPEQRKFLAVYERGGEPVAVLGMSQPKLFTRWRRQLRTVPQEA